jgi:hypothetical protein
MSDKLTPDELKAWPRKLGTTPLLDHIAAVETERDALESAINQRVDTIYKVILRLSTERDEAAALLNRFVSNYSDSHYVVCDLCGGEYGEHSSICLVTDARAWLAKVENETP